MNQVILKLMVTNGMLLQSIYRNYIFQLIYDQVLLHCTIGNWCCIPIEGNAKRNGNDHISLYLALAETNAISHGCQINVTLKFFIYDHIQDKYLIMQGRCIYLFFFC